MEKSQHFPWMRSRRFSKSPREQSTHVRHRTAAVRAVGHLAACGQGGTHRFLVWTLNCQNTHRPNNRFPEQIWFKTKGIPSSLSRVFSRLPEIRMSFYIASVLFLHILPSLGTAAIFFSNGRCESPDVQTSRSRSHFALAGQQWMWSMQQIACASFKATFSLLLQTIIILQVCFWSKHQYITMYFVERYQVRLNLCID